jgi:cell division inhibitor SepF
MFKKKKQEVMMNKLIYSDITQFDENLLKDFGKQILQGSPVLLNLSKIPINEKNKIILFLQGVIFSIEGTCQLIKEDIYIFGPSDTFSDNSVMEEIKKRL